MLLNIDSKGLCGMRHMFGALYNLDSRGVYEKRNIFWTFFSSKIIVVIRYIIFSSSMIYIVCSKYKEHSQKSYIYISEVPHTTLALIRL